MNHYKSSPIIKVAIMLISYILLIITTQGCTTSNSPLIEIKEVMITMADGVQLAADLYMPANRTHADKYPILLEYLPYRKDEHRKLRYPVFSYFVERGYIVARVDIRGTGRSQGKLVDYEYTEQEQEDGEEVIDWLSKQEFSNGAVGMFGISWGGFNAIHMAMRKPPALKAILAMMATDDIYEDDVHFMDGMMHVDAYEIGRDLKNVIPAAPHYQIDSSYFADRFDTEPWLLKYKRHQRDGAFWDRASLNSDYSKLEIPIFMISAWYDGYRDSTPRILKNVKAPKKALVGPWNHTFPHMAIPPPSIEWRHEAVKWFDYWLKSKENNILEEPELAVFIRENHNPGVPDSISGQWEWLDQWPPKNVTAQKFYLGEGSLRTDIPKTSKQLKLKYKASSGIEASGSVMWWGDWSPDISKSDQNSLVFESEPLNEDMVILGFPELEFQASVSAPQSHFISRLSEVSPGKTVTLITGAGLNGSHRNSSENPSFMKPGSSYPLKIEMHFTSWTFKKGNRIRLSLSNGQWPMIWPNPTPVSMTVLTGEEIPSMLSLPVVSREFQKEKPSFAKPGKDPKLPGYETSQFGTISGFAEISDSSYDPETGITKVIAKNSFETIYPWAKWSNSENIIHSVSDSNPANTSIESSYSIKIKTETQTLKWEGILSFTSDKENFYYNYTRKIFDESDKLIREKNWNEIISRDYQ